MSDSKTEVVDTGPIAPPLAPVAIHVILRDADALLAFMGKETLGVVAELANTLTISAHQAGAWEIEEAASNLRCIASGHGPIVLAAAMRSLTDAIARTENSLARNVAGLGGSSCAD